MSGTDFEVGIDDAFEVGVSEGEKTAYNEILKLIRTGHDLHFVRSWILMRLKAVNQYDRIKKVLREASQKRDDRELKPNAGEGSDPSD